MVHLLALSLIFLAGCGGLLTDPSPQKLNPAVYYKQDICITYRRDVNKHGEVGTWYRNRVKRKFRLFKKDKKYQEITICGVGVLPKDDSYNLEISHKGKLNYLIANTCHREVSAENPDKGIFKKNGKMYFDYKPTLEKNKTCPLYLAVYNQKRKHGWGTYAFESDAYKLPASVSCNGDEIDFGGTSICHARYNTIQKITFPEVVRPVRPVNGPAERKADCPVIAPKDGKVFEYKIPARECYYGFIGIKSGREHRLYTSGWEDIVVRDL